MTHYQVYSTRTGVEIITFRFERQARVAVKSLKAKGIPAAIKAITIEINDLELAK